MRYRSSRNKAESVSLTEAVNQGLASDGGLFIPEFLPHIKAEDFPDSLSYPDFSARVLTPFFAGDKLAGSLVEFCKQAFNFPLPLIRLGDNDFVLELFHGPTSSFKDFGARFLSLCLKAIAITPKIILVATSGDTGSAVASAFYKKANCRAVILYPQGKVSAKQEQQMTCWDDNIFAFAIKGSFDDCQRLVKSAFTDQKWNAHGELSSANSINIGRLLPQLTYYAYISLNFYRQHHKKPGFIIPSGNLGHATAAFWAQAMGFPIREIVMATNANRVLPDYLSSGVYKPTHSIPTLANAMDVGNPSNMERLTDMFKPFDTFKASVRAFSVSDEDIAKTIQQVEKQYHYLICPHTATAFFVRQQLDDKPWIMTATADPSKFDEVIEPLIGRAIPVAPQLQALLARPKQVFHVGADLDEILTCISERTP